MSPFAAALARYQALGLPRALVLWLALLDQPSPTARPTQFTTRTPDLALLFGAGYPGCEPLRYF